MFVTPKRAFLFDLDGTLADTLPDIAATTNHIRQSHGLSPVDTTTVRTYIGDGPKALLRRALAELAPNEGLHEALLEEAFASYIEHHRAQCTVHAQLYPGVQSHLILLREAGHGIAVVTNKLEQFAIPVARHLGLDPFTSVIIGGDPLPTKKPDPAMLAHPLEQLASPFPEVMDASYRNARPRRTEIGSGLWRRWIAEIELLPRSITSIELLKRTIT